MIFPFPKFGSVQIRHSSNEECIFHQILRHSIDHFPKINISSVSPQKRVKLSSFDENCTFIKKISPHDGVKFYGIGATGIFYQGPRAILDFYNSTKVPIFVREAIDVKDPGKYYMISSDSIIATYSGLRFEGKEFLRRFFYMLEIGSHTLDMSADPTQPGSHNDNIGDGYTQANVFFKKLNLSIEKDLGIYLHRSRTQFSSTIYKWSSLGMCCALISQKF